MWADRRWVGTLFPSDTRPGEELRPYATWCTAVEGNTTVYALPDEAAVARWGEHRAIVPEANKIRRVPDGMELIQARRLSDAINTAFQ